MLFTTFLKMKKVFLVFCWATAELLASCFGHLQAQTDIGEYQSFTQKIDMGNVNNKESIHFLLLCKSIPNANSKMSGTLTIET